MKFQHMGQNFKLWSDLHFMHYKDKGVKLAARIGKAGDGDTTLILAGDIFDGLPNLDFCRDMLRLCQGEFRDAIWILGNHEMLDQTPEETLRNANRIVSGLDNVKFLEMGSIDRGDFQIHAATGWFPYDTMNQVYEHYMLDFNHIRGFGKWVYDHHSKTRQWLKNVVRPQDIVITHHLPAQQCVDPYWQGDPLNRFFVGGFEDILTLNKPAIWCSGHSHSKQDILVNETRCLRNPSGYPSGG